MHKITKGLKKKKKGKKSKHKEDELFKPEELEAYRREHSHQQQTAEAGDNHQQPTDNEEWKKFNALTSGIDDILKKTQGDLDRIKSTSFFQRVPIESELKKKEEEEKAGELLEAKVVEPEVPPSTTSTVEAAIVLVSESESEYEDEDDIFDTTYIDAVTSGEIKLAYIPESPTKELEGDDPFDTRIADRAILGPSAIRKGTKLVPIGAAVEILTGRVQAPTYVKKPISRRDILREKNLLLGSFDDQPEDRLLTNRESGPTPLDSHSNLLDEDTPPILTKEPIDLSKNLHLEILVTQEKREVPQETPASKNGICADDDDDEFAQLAAESLSKPITSSQQFILDATVNAVKGWNAFDQQDNSTQGNVGFKKEDNHQTEEGEDPFDTTFAENILPGKAELKIIENEILNAKETECISKGENLLSELQQKVRIQVTDPSGERESISSLDIVSESELFSIKPVHRDLLGGSNTDLSQLSDTPLQPSESIDENYIEYTDPFDTSVVDSIKPGQTELKFLEKELLGDVKNRSNDDDFDPRVGELEQTVCQPRKVSFDLPLDVSQEESNKSAKPLTPYYIREDSIPEVEEVDPFDTSFVSNIGPGKVELKLIENELFTTSEICDQYFDPRDEKAVAVAKVVETIRQISDPSFCKPKVEIEPIDLLGTQEEVSAKVLTPSVETVEVASFDLDYSDPFDTSIASNILPGKTELKLLENELFNA